MLFSYYKIVNKINKKEYIGITQKEPEQRFREHRKNLKNHYHPNYLLQADYDIYGLENFDFIILEQIDYPTIEEGYEHEALLIKNMTAESYNLAPGGQINPMCSNEIKEKMTKTKQSVVPDIYQLEEIEENKFKVVNIFPSRKAAARENKLDFRNLCKAVNEHRVCKGFYYLEEKHIQNHQIVNWRPNARTSRAKPVARTIGGKIVEVHNSCRVFEEQYGQRPYSISAAICHGTSSFGRYYKYISDDEFYELKPIILVETCNDYPTVKAE